jgi:catechol 2,3-dioxygenase-like lactoylglutathione lyase family enzyme
MIEMLKFAATLLIFAVLSPAADLATPNAAGISWGHYHFNATDLEAAHKFWTILGAKPGKPVGPQQVYHVKNAVIVIRKAEPAGSSEATVVHHVGFKVKDLDASIEAVKAAGYRIITSPEAIAKNRKGNVMGPDGLNVELVADPALDAAIASHHVHFFTTSIEDTRAWYVKTFAAVPGKRDQFEAADVPGVNLSFSAARGGEPKGTKGYAVDHIGFEVKGLEAFCKKLEGSGIKFDVPYRTVPSIGLAIAFITDPWGTYIELTEGLGAAQ